MPWLIGLALFLGYRYGNNKKRRELIDRAIYQEQQKPYPDHEAINALWQERMKYNGLV